MCRQRAARSRVAMRAASLVLMVLGEDKDVLTVSGISALSYLASKYPYESFGSFLRTDRSLGDARFDLQIDNIPRGLEDTVYGNGLFSEVQNRTYIVQGLLID
jgi:hypothetical protein